MDKLKEVLEKIKREFNPVSIFLYGSRAKTDFLKRSDFEIGILFSKDNYVGRGNIKKVINEKGFNIYPFEYEEFLQGNIDTPFQKKIYLRELILAGKTLLGEKVIEKMKAPQISIIDLIQDLRFNLGYALASVISNRNEDKITASTEFYKSCLFATRTLIILKLKDFFLTYEEIFKNSKKLNLGEYEELVEKAYKIRKGESEYEDKDLFQNISFLNEFIEPLLIKYYNEGGNQILIN